MEGESVLKNKIIRMVKVLALVLVVLTISGTLNFALSPVTYGHWATHYRKEYSGKIDTVILGDSFPMYAVQPTLLDKEFECFSFNESTASQSIKESYYVLLDYLETEPVKTVYFGLDYYNFLASPEYQSEMSLHISYERIRSPKVKLSFLKEFVSFENIENWIFPFKLHREGILDVPGNIRSKLTNEYRNYLPLVSETYYYDKGYVYTDKVKDDVIGSFDMNEMNQEQIQWFEEIIKLCKERGVTLNVFQIPNKQARIDAIKNYDVYCDMVNELAEKYGFRYYDFNFHTDRGTLDDDSCFYDAGHLNNKGSTIFMDWFCEAFSYKEDVTDKYFAGVTN